MSNDVQFTLFPDNAEYDHFVKKFIPKRTTDDCYTPEAVMRAVEDFVADTYRIDKARFVRPFWPGKDYEKEEYSADAVVVDNPPFSILSQIIRFYCMRHIRFFLFANALTLFSGGINDVCYLPTAADIIYENGAKVKTSFVTNLEALQVHCYPKLKKMVEAASAKAWQLNRKGELPKYSYPDAVITAAIAQRYCHLGIEYKLDKRDCAFVRRLDAQKAEGKAIFGGGFLLSRRAAAERAAAERAAAERAAAERAAAERANITQWELSEREKALQKMLGKSGEAEAAARMRKSTASGDA